VRVCLDARKLWDSGIGTYIRGLLEGMAGLEDRPEWDFILKPGTALPEGDRSRIHQTYFSSAGNYSIAELFNISRIANATRAELFHAPHYVIPVGLKIPLVVTIHDLIHLVMPQYFSPVQRAYARWMLGRVARRAKVILTVSQHSKQDIVNVVGVSPDKIVVTYSGVFKRYFEKISDEQLIRFRVDFNLPTSYLLYIGNLKPHKNVSGLIESWRRLPNSLRPPLVILGPKNDEYPALMRQVQDLRMNGKITFLENLPNKFMPCLFRSATAYVQPSWYEGFGSPPLEAMAVGLPVAVSNRGSLPEIAGPAALIFDPDQPDEMVAVLEKLLADSSLRRDLIDKGRKRAEQFTWERIAQRTLEVYCRVCEER
jgi:glycosyltransferase involved in cell wall biosynthesis